jgi:uncharacterized DUF497 family protein
VGRYRILSIDRAEAAPYNLLRSLVGRLASQAHEVVFGGGDALWILSAIMSGTQTRRPRTSRSSIAFEEAATAFDDLMFITVVDDEHSADEERYITIGMSSQNRLLMVAHADRAGRIRIISARRATKKEGLFYAETE